MSFLTYGLGGTAIEIPTNNGFATDIVSVDLYQSFINTSLKIENMPVDLHIPLQSTVTFIKDDVTLNNIMTEDVEIC